jgi:Amt family ammonium transporter
MNKLKNFALLRLVIILLMGSISASVLVADSSSVDELYTSIVASGEVPDGLTDVQKASLYESFKADPGAFNRFVIDNLWIAISAGLVFLMHLGFATLESGLTQSKNTVNILFKNTYIVCLGVLTYLIWGFGLMYPGDFNGYFGFAGFMIPSTQAAASWDLATPLGYGLSMTTWTDFLFQAMFAATAATIVSGAVAERVKLSSFMIFSIPLVGIIYPIAGSWKWGGGFLDNAGFYDFAGSTLVHSVGGWAALAFVLVLGPRAGKYLEGGRIRPILGHSMPLAMIGVMLLWLGWFGFNGGSVLSADPVAVSFTLVTTCVAAAAGGLAAMLVSWYIIRKPDLSMALNGILAGLVGITAGADIIPVGSALVVGAIAGALVVFAVLFFDKMKIDDPVGALSVHLVCGIWGTLSVALFGRGLDAGVGTIGSQLLGIVSVGVFTFFLSLAFVFCVKAIMGIRVSADEEIGGLDVGEHGQEAYPDFQPSSR